MKCLNMPWCSPQNCASSSYQPTVRKSCSKHLLAVMAGTHLSRVINLSDMQNMIEQSPYQDGQANNTRLFEVTNTRTTLEPCLKNNNLQPNTHGVVKVHVWKNPFPFRASKSCCPARSSNYINWVTPNVTAIYLKKILWWKPANNETRPVTTVTSILHYCCPDEYLTQRIQWTKDAKKKAKSVRKNGAWQKARKDI